MDIGFGDGACAKGGLVAGILNGGGSAEEKLDASLGILAAMSRHFDLSADPAFFADERLCIVHCNPAFLRLIGGALRPRGDLASLYTGSDGPAFIQNVRTLLDTMGFWEGEIPNRSGRGESERLTLAALRRPAAAAYVGIIRDTSELRRAKARIAYSENHDGLTGLPNRQSYLAELDALLGENRGSKRAVASCVIDLDNFKRFNNDETREVGDDLLRAVASRLSDTARRGDFLARTGGDEFSLCFEAERELEAAGAAERILSAFASPFRVRGRLFHLRASMGIALGPAHGADAASLAAASDIALQARKSDGKTGFEMYREGLADRFVGASAFESELRQAMAAKAIEVHYQPIVDISDLGIASVEALARWRCDDGRSIPPSRFIPAAEETGIIFELGDRVLDAACTWRSSLGSDSGMGVCVNVSARQFQQPGFAGRTARRIADIGLSPRSVTLEITESCLLGDLAAAGRVVEEIRETGAKVVVDDFGVGFASLSYLKNLPVNGVKIDQSFVADIATNPQSRGIVEAVVYLARELGMETVAEGVETGEQLDAIRETGCGFAQGFLFSKALPGDEIRRVMEGGAFRCAEAPSGR